MMDGCITTMYWANNERDHWWSRSPWIYSVLNWNFFIYKYEWQWLNEAMNMNNETAITKMSSISFFSSTELTGRTQRNWDWHFLLHRGTSFPKQQLLWWFRDHGWWGVPKADLWTLRSYLWESRARSRVHRQCLYLPWATHKWDSAGLWSQNSNNRYNKRLNIKNIVVSSSCYNKVVFWSHSSTLLWILLFM